MARSDSPTAARLSSGALPFLIALLAILPLRPAFAQSTTIRGSVVDARTAKPLADAHIEIIEAQKAAQADAQGRFEFAGIAPGTYTLTVSTVGYIFVRRRIDVPANGLDLTVPLAEGTGTYEETVNVVPEASTAPTGPLRELGSGMLQDLRGVAADDPVRAVQALPGVATGDDFQAEFSFHGSAYRHLGLVLDGVATSLLFHSVRGVEDSGSIAMINTDVLGHASFASGAHPMRDGDWLGATLSFDVREGSRDRVTVRGAVSGTNASTVLEGPLGPKKRGSWLISLRRSYVDWLIKKIDPNFESTIGFTDSQAKAAYDLTSRQQLQLTVLGGRTIYQKPGATSANDVRRASSTSLLASAGWRYTAPRALLTQRLSVVDNRFRNRGLFLQQQARGDTRVVVWRGDATVPIRGWMLETGLTRERQRGSVVLRNFTGSTAATTRLRAEQALAATRTLTGGWAQAGGQIAGTGVTAGVRVTGDSLTDETVASPWLLLQRQIGLVQLSGGASRVVQFPTIDRQAQAITRLAPERAWMVDGTARLPLSRSVFLSTTVFRRHESDVLRRINENRLVNGTRITESLFPTLAAQLDGTSRGIDVAMERRADHGPTGWVGYSWAHTRHRDTVTGEQFDGDFDQRHTLNVFVQQRLSYRLKATAKFRYGSNVPFVGYYTGSNDALFLGPDRNTVRLPAYARLDLSASRTFTYDRSRLTLFVEIMNATGRRNFGPADGAIRTNFAAVGFSEHLIPFLPSAGLLVEF